MAKYSQLKVKDFKFNYLRDKKRNKQRDLNLAYIIMKLLMKHFDTYIYNFAIEFC